MTKKSIIIDTDMALDDWMAILYLLKEPNAHIKAITVSGTGEAHREYGIKNALSLLELAQNSSIPVAAGREKPLQGNNTFIRPMRALVDKTFGIPLPTLSFQNCSPTENAVDLLRSVIQNTEEKVHILVIGPLTNIAEFLQRYPDLKNRIERFYIMGGAISAPGNVLLSAFTYNTTAEMNIYIDPLAASIVFHSGIPITLVPLDITNTLPIDIKFYRELEKIKDATPITNYLYKLIRRTRLLLYMKIMYFWDPLTAVIMMYPELCTTKKVLLDIVLTPGKHLGRTKINANGVEVDVVETTDGEQVKKLLLEQYANKNGLSTNFSN